MAAGLGNELLIVPYIVFVRSERNRALLIMWGKKWVRYRQRCKHCKIYRLFLLGINGSD